VPGFWWPCFPVAVEGIACSHGAILNAQTTQVPIWAPSPEAARWAAWRAPSVAAGALQAPLGERVQTVTLAASPRRQVPGPC